MVLRPYPHAPRPGSKPAPAGRLLGCTQAPWYPAPMEQLNLPATKAERTLLQRLRVVDMARDELLQELAALRKGLPKRVGG